MLIAIILHFLFFQFATLEMSRRLEPKCVPQLFLEWLLGTYQSAIGYFFPVPEVFADVNSAQFLSRF